MIEINDREIVKFESALKLFASRAYPFATKATINSAAFDARKVARRFIKSNFINRNKFTANSILVDQARTLNVNRQAATIGSIASYLATQEFGGTKMKAGKVGVPIPTSFSAGQSQEAQPRTRLPRQANRLANIQLLRVRRRATNRRQRNAITVKEAANTGRKYVYLDLSRRKGIFEVTGTTKHPRVKMIYDLSRGSVSIPRRPWLEPTLTAVQAKIPEMYRKALLFQLNRQGLFK